MKNLTFEDLRQNLSHLRDIRMDLVMSSKDLSASPQGALITPEMPSVVTEHGVGLPRAYWTLTEHALSQVATKWKIPVRYLRSLRESSAGEFTDLAADILRTHFVADPMDILVRGLREPDDTSGVIRAVMSSKYAFVEHFDVLTAVFDGLRLARDQHGIVFEPGVASLSDTHMRARVNMPSLSVVARELLKDYRSPYTGATGIDNPNVFLGFEIRNSEVGAGSFMIVPVIVIQVCNNGMTLTKDLFRKRHLGAKMSEGAISSRTMKATMELISSQTVDYVTEIATPAFLQAQVDELQGLAVPVQPTLVQEHLVAAYSEVHANAIFDAFIMSGDITAFGVAQAMTFVSQSDAFSADDARVADDEAITIAGQIAKLALV